MMNNLLEKGMNKPGRITWKQVGQDLLSVLNFEKGLLFTIKGLLLMPKDVIDEYLYQNRSKMAHPLRFLFLSTALLTFMNYSVFNSKITIKDRNTEKKQINVGEELLEEDEEGEAVIVFEEDTLEDKEKRIQKAKEITEVIFSNTDKITFAMVPVFALLAFVFYRKHGYNYVEHLVIMAYMVSAWNVLELAMLIPVEVWPIMSSGVSSLVGFVFSIYFLIRMYSIRTFFGVVSVLSTIFLTYFIIVVIIVMMILLWVV